MPAAAAGAVTATELQQAIFNAPPASSMLASAPAGSLKPTPVKEQEEEEASSPQGVKRRRDDESDDEDAPMDEDDGGDAPMEDSSDDE